MLVHAAWLIPAFPLVGFALLILGGRKLGDPLAGWFATLMAAGSFASAVATFIGLSSRAADNRTFVQFLWHWVPVGGFNIDVSLRVDQLSILMALFVTGVGSLIHMYSVGYMKGDPRYPHFFVYLNLFLLSMLVLVLADNFVLTFLGWEGVGTCSYLLISFWFERETAASAGKKAFVTNRVGDWGFMVAMFLIFSHFGSLAYGDVLTKSSVAAHLTHDSATWICLALFLGACGKSAQLPLYVWLPDAMEGPTPVSALIHAATMVTAGVYLMARISPMLALAPGVATTVAVVGAATALFAATIACAQNDIKRVLAYSTISQLGYMFLAIGSGAYVAGLFHMVTHAFFKALLFLCAGAVIHGLHQQQDMKAMGALRKWMPVTAACFLVAWLAISGIPPFAGFWSKDDILAAAWHKSVVLWAVGWVTAGLTAYYMSRQVALVFFGKERWRDADADSHGDSPAADSHGDSAAADAHGDSHVAEPHEATWPMLVPLVLLAGLSVVGGLVNLPFKPLNLLDKWLDPLFGQYTAASVATGTKVVLAIAATAAGLIGIGAGLGIWTRSETHTRLEPAPLRNAWYIDWLYARVIEKPGLALSNVSAFVVDKRIIDGAVNGLGSAVRGSGQQLRKLQTGYVRNYALGIAAGTVLILGYVVVRAA
ncbi:MAG: NADH-quinone oxidoreductase subunit L [Acidimicrobiales bacterium]